MSMIFASKLTSTLVVSCLLRLAHSASDQLTPKPMPEAYANAMELDSCAPDKDITGKTHLVAFEDGINYFCKFYKGKVYLDKASEISLSRQAKDNNGTWEPWITNITAIKTSNNEAKVQSGGKKPVKIRFAKKGGPTEFAADYETVTTFLAL